MTVPADETRTLALLDRVPEGSATALVIRHAEREDIPRGTFGNDVPLTDRGWQAACGLGKRLSHQPAGIVRTSPLPRCVQTARDPGPFVVDAEVAGRFILDNGIPALVVQQLSATGPPGGMRSTSAGVRLVLNSVSDALRSQRGVSVFVTHDAVLAVLVGSLYGLAVDDFRWPGYLDALVLWADSERIRFLWHGLDEGSYPIGG